MNLAQNVASHEALIVLTKSVYIPARRITNGEKKKITLSKGTCGMLASDDLHPCLLADRTIHIGVMVNFEDSPGKPVLVVPLDAVRLVD